MSNRKMALYNTTFAFRVKNVMSHFLLCSNFVNLLIQCIVFIYWVEIDTKKIPWVLDKNLILSAILRSIQTYFGF